MTDQQFAAQILGLFQQYVTWLAENKNPVYGAQPVQGSYGGSVAPTFSGFMKWMEFIFLTSQA